MQNSITGSSTINLEEIITNNLSSATEAKTAQGNDFAQVLKDISKDKRDYTSDNRNTQNDRHPAQNDKHAVQNDNRTIRDNKKTDNTTAVKDDNKTQTSQNSKTENKKNVDTFETQNVSKELTQTNKDTNTEVLSADETIKEAINRLNDLIENAVDGQLDTQNVADIMATLDEIQTKIDNNEIVVSEQTQKMLTDITDRLATQDPKTLEIKALAADLKQLQQDIQANTFKTQSQVKLEDDMNNPLKALEINLDDTQPVQTKDTKAQESTVVKQTKDTQTVVQVSQNVKTDNDTKVQNPADEVLEQDMVDEMDVKIEDISESSTDTSSQNQSYTTAQDEVIKLKIENSDSSNTPVTFNFDNRIQNAAQTNMKAAPVETVANEINKTDILNQIGSKFEQLKDGSNTKITMTLRPQDLGRVTIEMTQNANGITTNIIAQNSQVKELLDKNIDILKQQLAQQGVNVQNVQVKTVEQNAQASFSNNYDDKENPQQQQDQTRGQNQQNPGQNRGNFNFTGSNVIDNADFDSSDSQIAQIHTASGKIKYNI